jgi:hypothetical protein
MLILFQVPVKRVICEDRRTAVECVIDHGKRSNNWNQSHWRTEEGAASNRYEGRPKSCPAVRDFAKGCCCIVQRRRACVSPTPSLSPEERVPRIILTRQDLSHLPRRESECEPQEPLVNFEIRCCFGHRHSGNRIHSAIFGIESVAQCRPIARQILSTSNAPDRLIAGLVFFDSPDIFNAVHRGGAPARHFGFRSTFHG